MSDVFRTVATLSYQSNVVSLDKGPMDELQELLQKRVEAKLIELGPDWQLAWGPVVWKFMEDPETGPDNAWFIAHHPRLEYEDGTVHPTYVVSIAGTPPESTYAWIIENFGVSSVCDFNSWMARGVQTPPVTVPRDEVQEGVPYISTGTATGVHILVSTPSPPRAASPHQTLIDFFLNLGESHSAPLRVIFTGGSLGGALSPTLALAVTTSRYLPPGVSRTYPWAGPSPGNNSFAEIFTSMFPPDKSPGSSPYQGWNLNLVNRLDIVPQAWAVNGELSPEQNLQNIPVLYGPPVKEVVDFVGVATLIANSSGVNYCPLESQYFAGERPVDPPTDLPSFLQVALPEHTKNYLIEFGIAPQDGEGLHRPHPRHKTEAEVRLSYPVISQLEWGLEHPKEAQKEIEKTRGGA